MNKPNRIISILQHKCPRCRTGKMFSQKYFWPFKGMLDMPERCHSCGQKMELETGFYFGTGYISYALSCAILLAFFVAYHLILGLTWRDNSMIICLISSIVFLIMCQPILMRISRVIYLHIFVPYEPTWRNNILK
jgi:uncharacterized protein (DUF983 family)